MKEKVTFLQITESEFRSRVPVIMVEAILAAGFDQEIDIVVAGKRWFICSVGLDQARGLFLRFIDVHPQIGENLFNGMIAEQQEDGSYQVYADHFSLK